MKNYNIYLIPIETETKIREASLLKVENKNFIGINGQINTAKGFKELEIVKNILPYQSQEVLNDLIEGLIDLKEKEVENLRIKIVKPEGEKIKINLKPEEFDYILEDNFITELEIAQNLIDRVKEVIGQMRDDVKKEAGKNRIAISTCGSHDIYEILEHLIITESISDELDSMVTSDYKTISEISVTIIEFIINEIKKFKTKEEISQVFINGDNFYFKSDTWKVIDENIASIISQKTK